MDATTLYAFIALALILAGASRKRLASKLQTIPKQIARKRNYYSIGSLTCIILLLLGSVQYYPYMANLSFDNSAYGQEQSIEVEDGRVSIEDGQEQSIEVEDGRVSIEDGQEQSIDDDRSEDRSNNDTAASTTSIEDDDAGEDTQPPREEEDDDAGEDTQPPREEEDDDAGEDTQPPPPPPQQVQPPPPPPQQVQPDSGTSLMPTEDGASEDNSSEQSTGPVKFAFVDSFWTDFTSLGGVVASTSSESITAQPLPPVIKQEVEPGEGEAVLAVVLRNVGFADATSISGSLDLPPGFRALVTPEDVDSDTALSSYNGIVNAGQTFTFYFRIEITEESQVGREYIGELKIRYFNVAEQEEEDTRSTTLDIPFRLSGKVILNTAAVMIPFSSTTSQEVAPSLSSIVSVNPGVVNPLKIEISNNGSAIATGVIVEVLPSSPISSSSAQTVVDGSGSSTNDNNSAESTTSAPVTQQSVSSTPSPATMVVVGSSTFDVGLIDANAKKEIVPTIFPADTAAGTLTTLNIQISYNDAYGNKKTLNKVLGVQVSPESPQSGLNVLPSSLTSLDRVPESSQPPLTRTTLGVPSNNSTPNQSEVGSSITNSNSSSSSSSSTQAQSIQIAAGSVQDLSFAISNTNDARVSIADVVVSLTSESDAVRILGDSRWNLQSIAAGSEQELTTRVYASTSLIGSPVFFTVTMQYIRNGNELRTESFQLGAIVVGNIQISVNDVTISYIGDTPNLVGNLLNEGNSPALFTTIELVGSGTQERPQLLRPTVSSQFLGDLAVNSPLPFNIPLQITQQNIGQEVTLNGYPISLRITYSDELRNTHELIVDETINLEPIQARTGQQIGASSQQNALLNNGFVDAYWVDSSLAASSTSSGNLSSAAGTTTSTLPSEREVGPGEGPSFLAVVLSNTAFSDITGIIGYLSLPEGFAATTTTTTAASSVNTTNGTSSDKTSSQTAIASLSNIVRAGQTYTLYFKVNVLEAAQKDFHEALLRINYFKVPEPQPGTYRVQTITVPFELPGRVILDASSDTDDLVPGEANELTLRIRNTGSADAHSVIVNINAIGGSIITNEAEATDSTRSNNASSNEIGTDRQPDQQQQQQQQQPSSAAVASVGSRTFNIGSIPANGSAEIATTVYPSSLAGGTLQNLDIEISYNDANGNRRSIPLSLGFRVQPNPPEGGLSVAPSSLDIKHQERIILASTITGSPAGNAENNASSNDSSEVTIIAGRAHDLNFNITNNNRNPITDIVVTLAPRSESLEILGDSRWTVQELAAQSKARFSTRVFASESLIGSPVSFEVGVQYISGDQIKSDSFSLGGNVIGEIEITVNDLSVRYIGDIPNLTGNLLNQGNTQALFTTIEMLSNSTSSDQSNFVPVTDTSQYLGDLEDNSPLPFSIPLAIGTNDDNGNNSSSGLRAGSYPISLRITYSDELRNTHEVILDGTVSYSPPQQEEDDPNQGFLGFSSSSNAESGTTTSVLPLLFIFAAIVAAATVAIIVIKRRRSRSKKISKLMAEQGDDDDFEPFSSDEHRGSSKEDQSSHNR